MDGETAIALVTLTAGIVALYVGAELLVAGAGRIAHGVGLRAATVGVTVIALVTTAPELFVAMIGALNVDPDVGLGAVLGSNIANVGLVLGLAALIRPLRVTDTVMRRHVPFMILAAVLCYGLAAFDGQLGRVDGVIMLAVLGTFTAYLVYYVNADPAPVADESVGAGDSTAGEAPVGSDDAVEGADPKGRPHPTARYGIGVRDVALVVAGLVALVVGSRWLVSGGTTLLSEMGFSSLFIGLTVLALGTSLPELAASVVGAIRGETGFAIGNVVGSNIYNVLAVLGIVAVVVPIPVSTGTLRFELPAMVAFTLLVVGLMWHGRRLSRVDGAILVGAYVVFVYLLFP